MNPNLKFDTAVFVYNYLRNIYDLIYREDVDSGNIVWGFGAIGVQICIVNVENFHNPEISLQAVLDNISSRQTNNIKLTAYTVQPKENKFSLLNFGLINFKSVLKIRDISKVIKRHIPEFQSKLIKDTFELKKIFKLTSSISHFSPKNLKNLIFLINKSLIIARVIYKASTENPIGIVVIFPLKAFTVLELILFMPENLSENTLLQMLATVLSDKIINNAKDLVIISQNWEEANSDKIIKVGEIQYYLKKNIKNTLLPIPVLLKNDVLKTKSEYLSSINIINTLGLPKHHDVPKNWDTLAALSQIINNISIEKSSAILDAGGEYYSVILYHLAAYRYTNLHCVNLAFSKSRKIGNISYQKGDITKTTFNNNTFSAITCLSVIEHVPDIERYFEEMSRILKYDGILFISTDYWKNEIDTQGKKSYGAPFKIFDNKGINCLIDIAKKNKLELTAPLKLSCKNKVVSCDGFKYTFIYLTFKKIHKGQY